MYPHQMLIEEVPKTVAAIGFFDGIHKGHQKVIKSAVREARTRHMESAVITFHPHPSVILKQGTEHVEYITPLREKQEILEKLGVDRLYIISFNEELSLLSSEAFIDHFIIGLHIKHLIAGFDFSYGYKGQGNMFTIDKYTKNAFTYSIINKVMLADEKISSTKIRKLLTTGEIEAANILLGRPLSLRGVVIPGDQRGRTIGYPTANLEVHADALLPKPGVYAVKVLYKNMYYNGMANLGKKPTFESESIGLSLEVNILDFDHELYGEELQIEWQKFIREEKKFPSIEELIDQIQADEKNIRSFFKII